MSFSEETKQIMKHYLELYLKGTIIREEQDVLDAYVEEIKNSTNPEDIAFVKTVFLLNIANTIAPIKTTTKPIEPMIIDFLDNFKDFITKNQLLF